MPLWPRVVSLLLLASVSACTVATPFSGPGNDWSTGPVDGPERVVTISITHITLKSDSAARGRFWRSVREVEAAIRDQPGLIGYAKRTELVGNEAWTVSAWESEANMLGFIRSPAHSAAMERAAGSYDMARFARISVSSGKLPLPWPEILDLLARNERNYYE